MIKKNEAFLVKLQSVFGTPESSLTFADDFHPVMDSSKADIVPQFNEIKTVSAGFDQDLSVLGLVNGNVGLDYYLRSLGFATEPDWGIPAQACGFTKTATEYLEVTTGADKSSTWIVGHAVRNTTGGGNHWTGTIAYISTTTIRITYLTGTYAAVDISEGIENTTVEPDVSTTISAKAQKYKYAYALGNTTKDITVWHYKGGRGTSASVLQKYGNIVGDWKISGETGKPGQFSFTGGKAKVVAADTIATLGTPTKNRNSIPAIFPTVSIFGVAYKLQKFEITGNVAVEQRIDGSETYGYGACEIGDVAPKFSMTFLADASLTLPMTGMLNSTAESAITILWGNTGEKIYLNIPYPQATDVKYAEAGNLTVYDVSGIITQNNFSATANNDLT